MVGAKYGSFLNPSARPFFHLHSGRYAGWLLLLLASSWAAPALDDVVTSGEFVFLPKDAPSRRGEDLFERAWGETVPSRVVIVVLSFLHI